MRKVLALFLALQICSPAWAQIVLPGGGSGSGGGVSSFSATCPAVGPSTGAVTLSNGVPAVAKTTAYTVLAADCGKFFEVTNTTTITLPSTTSVSSGFGIILFNSGAGTVTAAVNGTSGGTINANGATQTSLAISSGAQLGLVLNAAGNGWDGSPTLTGSGSPSIGGPGYVASVWYNPFGTIVQGVAGGAVPTITTAECSIIWLPNISSAGGGTGTLGSLDLGVVTAGTTTATVALYANDPTATPYRPGVLLDASANIANTATGSFVLPLTAPTTGVSIPANALYWGCVQSGDTAFKYRTQSLTNGQILPYQWFVGTTTPGSNNGASGTPIAGVNTTTGITSFGTWPSTFHGATFTEVTAQAPWFSFQFSSVP